MNTNFKTLCLTIMLLTVSCAVSQAQQRLSKDYTNASTEVFMAKEQLNKAINPTNFDFDLFHALLVHLSNQERIKQGIPPLSNYWNLEEAAILHSKEMSDKHFFSHTNKSVKKYRTPANRILHFNDSYKTLGENIVTNNLMDFDGSTLEYQIKVINGEAHYYDINNKELAYTSYLKLGKRLTKQWMDSAPHKANILSIDFTLLGCGCALEDTGDFVTINCTQNFGSLFD